jgi:preprotein translocase subunit SecG
MAIFKTLLVIVQVLSALGVIGLAAAARQGCRHGCGVRIGASGSLFGATGSANFLSRTTAVLAALFFCCTLGLTLLGNYKPSASLGVMGAAQRRRRPLRHPLPRLPQLQHRPAPAARPCRSNCNN